MPEPAAATEVGAAEAAEQEPDAAHPQHHAEAAVAAAGSSDAAAEQNVQDAVPQPTDDEPSPPDP